MQLKNGCRYFRCHRTEKCFLYRIGFIFTGHNHHHFLCLNDVTDSHRKCLTRYIIRTGKEPFVCFNGRFCQIYAMCALCKHLIRFIETNMSVSANSQKLDINSTYTADDLIIICTCFVAVFFQSIWYIGFVFVNVYMIEQVCVS